MRLGFIQTLLRSKEDERMRSEERRALVLLGITAILAAFYSAMLSDIWTGKNNETDFYFNIPPVSSPARHATYYWIPILQYMIAFWMIYALFVFLYFSVDWFTLRIRKVFHGIATVFMGFYFLYVSAFVPLTSFIIVWITDPVEQGILLALALSFISILELDFVFFTSGHGAIFIAPTLRKIVRRLRGGSPSDESEFGRYAYQPE